LTKWVKSEFKRAENLAIFAGFPQETLSGPILLRRWDNFAGKKRLLNRKQSFMLK
jgi:hypothetical protein